MPDAENKFSALLYRFRGYILGLIAVSLVLVPPRINGCAIGIVIAVVLYAASAFLRVRTRQFIGEHTRGNVHAADALVTCGAYARVRHPLYISNTGFALGIAFFHLGISLWVLPFMLFSLFMVPVFTGCGKEDVPQGHASAESYAPWGDDTAGFWSKQTSAIGATTTNI